MIRFTLYNTITINIYSQQKRQIIKDCYCFCYIRLKNNSKLNLCTYNSNHPKSITVNVETRVTVKSSKTQQSFRKQPYLMLPIYNQDKKSTLCSILHIASNTHLLYDNYRNRTRCSILRRNNE